MTMQTPRQNYKQDGTQTVWGADDEARAVPFYKPTPGHSAREVVKTLGLREMARGEDRGLCTAVIDCSGGVLLYCAPVAS